MGQIINVPNYGQVEFPDGMSDAEIVAAIKKNAMSYQTKEPDKPEPYDIPAGVKSAMNVGQALSFGFGDEIAGALGADKDRYRSTLDDFKKEYPGSAMLGTVSGSMLLPGMAGQLSRFNPWATTAAVGGLQAAAQGAGDAKDTGSMAHDAVAQGATGVLAAPLLMGGMKAVGSVANPIMETVGSRLPVIGDNITDFLAKNRVVNSFERDNLDAAQVGANMRRLGDEARIADGGGQSTFNALDINATLPGKTGQMARDVIENRIATRPERMDTIVDKVNGGYGRANDVLTSLITQKQQAAAPLYQKVHALDIAPPAALVGKVKAALDLGAGKEAEKIATALEVPFDLPNALANGGKLSMRDLDHLKQGMDKLIQKETSSDGKLSSVGRAYVELNKGIIKQLDFATSNKYKAARDAFAGPAALEDAITSGQRFINSDATKLERQLSAMSDSEREAFKIGASEALRQKFGSQSGQTEFINAWKNKNVREKLKAVLGDDTKLDDVLAILNNERQLKRLESVGHGSQTAKRLAAGEDQTDQVAADALGTLGKAATGQFWPTLLGAVRNRSMTGTPEPVRDAIGEILLKRYDQTYLDELLNAQKLFRARNAGNSAAIGGASVPAAGYLQGLLSQ